MSDPKPKPGDLICNAEGLAVIDVTPEEINHYIKFRDGVEKALTCVECLKPEDIKRAGLNPATVQETLDLISDYRRATELHPVSEKLTELLYETKMHRAHRISLNLGELAAQTRRRGEREPNGAEILGPLKDLLDYQFGPGKKAAATRAKGRSAPEGQQKPEGAAKPEGATKPEEGTKPDGGTKPEGTINPGEPLEPKPGVEEPDAA